MSRCSSRSLPQDGSNNPEHRVLGKGWVEAEGKVPRKNWGHKVGGCGENTPAQTERMGENRRKRNERAEREKERVSNKQARKEPNSTMRSNAHEKQKAVRCETERGFLFGLVFFILLPFFLFV